MGFKSEKDNRETGRVSMIQLAVREFLLLPGFCMYCFCHTRIPFLGT